MQPIVNRKGDGNDETRGKLGVIRRLSHGDRLQISGHGRLRRHRAVGHRRHERAPGAGSLARVAPEIKRLSAEYGLALLAMEQPSQDPARMETAYQAAAEIGIPIINCGPGGKSGDEASLQQADRFAGRAGGAGRQVRRDAVRQSARGRRHLQHAHHPARDGGHLLAPFRHRHGPLAYLPGG